MLYAEVGSNELHLLRYIYLSTFLKKMILLGVLNHYTFYFYLSRFVKKKLHSYSATLGYNELVTFLFTSLVFYTSLFLSPRVRIILMFFFWQRENLH